MKYLCLIKTLGIGLLFSLSLNVQALVPIEGLLQGEVSEDIQFDPMALVFRPERETSQESKVLHKNYIAQYQEALELRQSCDFLGTASYATPTDEARARRSVVATLQYIGLDMVVKAIGVYGKTTQMSEDDYQKFAENLVASSCSPNISVYGIKLIKQNLKLAYNKAQIGLPTLPGMPYAAARLSEKANSLTTKEQEFHQTTKLFRALCSWGGDTNNYRLLPPLLSSPLVMATVLRHLDSRSLEWSEQKKQMISKKSETAVQVLCEDQLCRRVDRGVFVSKFPRLIGSSGIDQDVKRMWCSHFRYQDLQGGATQHPQVKAWIKKMDPEHEKQMIGQMLALMTGVPDLVLTSKTYKELAEDLRSSVDERWDEWATMALKGFSRDLLFEESLEIKVRPRRDAISIRDKLFIVELTVTMGEMDRLLQNNDKLRLDTSIKVSRNWLRWLRTQWNVVNQKADPGARDEFMAQVSAFLQPQIANKQKYFPTPLFGDGLEELVAQELIEQLLRYQGGLFDSYEDKMVTVPIRFHYGMFALSYMRYKAQIKAKQKSLDL